jgi:hypothetical protein
MPTVVSVAPEGSAWAVRCPDVFDNPLLFQSGARAEAAARRLSEHLSRGGLDCLLELRLRDGALAGRFRRPAASAGVRPLARAA